LTRVLKKLWLIAILIYRTALTSHPKEYSMSTLQDLLAQKAQLDQEIHNTQKRERSDAISKIKTLMQEYNLSASDISGKVSSKGSASKGGKVAAKFVDKISGNRWSGRGLQPKWLKAALASGKKLADFAV
jgi:DNA-binding protein H-NS